MTDAPTRPLPTRPAAPARPQLDPPTVPIAVPRAPSGVVTGGISSSVWVVATLVGLVAAGVRATGLTTANDVFIDELTYAELATTVASGRLPELFGQPFFLHPPGGFLLDAVVIRLFELDGLRMLDLVLVLRWAHALLGALLVVLGFLVVRKLTGTASALIAAGVLAFDPFVLRLDTRVMLETAMTVWVLTGLLALLYAVHAPPGYRRIVLEAGAGLGFGLAIFTKDMSALPIAVLLVGAVLWRRTLPASSLIRILPSMTVPYLAGMAVITANGLLGPWWDEKSYGLRRMIGAEQTTGFNMPGAPSLLPRLVEQMNRFGSSYVLLVLCVVVGVVGAVWAGRADRRLAAILAIGASGTGAYAVVAGTLEEQFGYIVVVTAVPACAVVLAELRERRHARRGALAVALAFLAVTVVLGARERTTPDDGFVQARAWLESSLPAGSRVGLTGVTAEFGLLPHDDWGVWPSLESLSRNDAEYVLTQSHTLLQGYGYADPALLPWLEHNATRVYAVVGPSNGRTEVWQLDAATLDAALEDGHLLPPVSGGYP